MNTPPKYWLILLCSISALSFVVVEPFKPNTDFPEPVYNFEKNPMDSKKVKLGRYLFYDPVLSLDSSISCSSCHSSFNAFAHTDHNLSHGIDDIVGERNAPALFNLAWQSSFMWDGAINHLDMQALAPISHPGEMAEDIEHVVSKLRNSTLYKQVFEEAYGDPSITGERILKALAQFQLTLVSDQSKYDLVKQGKTTFTEQEQSGYDLFQQNCNSCHTEPLFSSYEFATNGLPADSALQDSGRYEITRKIEDQFLFKIPSLRNLKYSYPYMHDGRYTKIKQVLDHYTEIDLSKGSPDQRLSKPIVLNSAQKTDLIAFLMTLNDERFVFNEKHRFPMELLKNKEGNQN